METLIALVLRSALGQEPEVDGLIGRLSADSIDEREDAFRRLEAAGRTAMPALERAAEGPDGETSARARDLLRRIPLREQVGPELLRRLPGAVDRLMTGESGAVFLEAARDLALPPGERAHPELEPAQLSGLAPMAVRDARSRQERTGILDASARLGLRSVWPEAVTTLSSDDAGERAASIRYLEKIKPREASSRLIVLAAHPRVEVRRGACSVLALLGALEAVPVLTLRLRDPDPTLRSVAAYGLGKLSARSSLPQLLQNLSDPNEDVRWWTVTALAAIRSPDACAPLEKLRDDPAPQVRRAVADALQACAPRP